MADEQPRSNLPLYGAVFALVVYFGAIGPWNDELDTLQQKVEQDKAAAANPSRLLNLARKAQHQLDAKRTRLTNILSNLPPADHMEGIPFSAADMFAVVVAAAAKHGLTAPDIRPINPVKNQFFHGEGCSFEVSAPREQDVYTFLHTLETDPSRPRIRSIAIDAGSQQRGLVTARISVAWVRFLPAGVSAVKEVKTTSTSLPDPKDMSTWALFAPRPVIVSPRPTPKPVVPAVAEGGGEHGEDKGNGTDEDKGKDKGKDSEPPAAPAALVIDLVGTITIEDRDGVILPLGGSQTLLMVGDEYQGYTLEAVMPRKAVFRRGDRTVDVLLKRESLLTEDGAAADSVDGSSPAAPAAPRLPRRTTLGLKAVFASASQIDGGRDLVRDGFRRGMLVREIDAASLAEELRFEPGDFVYTIDDAPVRTPTQLRIAADKVGRSEPVAFGLVRRGVRMTVASTP